jgi:hypothetical protein
MHPEIYSGGGWRANRATKNHLAKKSKLAENDQGNAK